MSYYKPTRTFSADEGDWSVDERGPEAIENDLDEINAMFDPTAEHEDGEQGGISFENLKFNFSDTGFAARIGAAALSYFDNVTNIQAVIGKIVSKLQGHDTLVPDAESYATGKRNGVDVDSSDPAYHNNSKYYSEQSLDYKKDSEAYAIGKRNGTDVTSEDTAYHNNSKYYSEVGADHSATSEAYATGKRNNTDVTSGDAAYHNNSKYYSEQSLNHKKDSEAYAIGKRNGVDVSSDDPAYHNNAKFYANVAEGLVNYVTPETYGAVGDGVTDDSSAFRSCLSNGNVVVIPRKSYYLSESIIANNCDVVLDNATYTNIKPAYSSKFLLESFSQYSKEHNYSLLSSESYVEGIAFNTKTNKIILAARDYNSSSPKTTLYVMNPETYAVENTYDYNISIVNSLAYNGTTNKLLVQCYSTDVGIHVINGDTMAYEGLLAIPNDWLYWGYDNKTHLYAATKMHGTDNQYLIRIYDDYFTLLKEISVPFSDTPLAHQGVEFYDGKVYQVTWTCILEVDIAAGSVNRIDFRFPLEVEDICFDGNGYGYLAAHNATINGYEYLYKFNPYRKAVMSFDKRNNYAETSTDINLNYLIDNGQYNVSLTNSNNSPTYNFPFGESDGLLIVHSVIGDDYTVASLNTYQIFLSKSAQYYIYTRRKHGNDSWGNWIRGLSGELKIYSQSSAGITYNITYCSGSNVYYDVSGNVAQFGGWVKLKAGTTPQNTQLITNLPKNNGPNTVIFLTRLDGSLIIPLIFDRGTTYFKNIRAYTLSEEESFYISAFRTFI